MSPSFAKAYGMISLLVLGSQAVASEGSVPLELLPVGITFSTREGSLRLDRFHDEVGVAFSSASLPNRTRHLRRTQVCSTLGNPCSTRWWELQECCSGGICSSDVCKACSLPGDSCPHWRDCIGGSICAHSEMWCDAGVCKACPANCPCNLEVARSGYCSQGFCNHDFRPVGSHPHITCNACKQAGVACTKADLCCADGASGRCVHGTCEACPSGYSYVLGHGHSSWGQRCAPSLGKRVCPAGTGMIGVNSCQGCCGICPNDPNCEAPGARHDCCSRCKDGYTLDKTTLLCEICPSVGWACNALGCCDGEEHLQCKSGMDGIMNMDEIQTKEQLQHKSGVESNMKAGSFSNRHWFWAMLAAPTYDGPAGREPRFMLDGCRSILREAFWSYGLNSYSRLITWAFVNGAPLPQELWMLQLEVTDEAPGHSDIIRVRSNTGNSTWEFSTDLVDAIRHAIQGAIAYCFRPPGRFRLKLQPPASSPASGPWLPLVPQPSASAAAAGTSPPQPGSPRDDVERLPMRLEPLLQPDLSPEQQQQQPGSPRDDEEPVPVLLTVFIPSPAADLAAADPTAPVR